MQKKLNYRFNNPNTAEATADYLIELLARANNEKLHSQISTCCVLNANNEPAENSSQILNSK